MNTKFIPNLVIALITFGANNSFATHAAPLSRAQVQAEYFRAVKDGALPPVGDIAYPLSTKFESTKNRGQVQAEYFQAVKDGTLPPVGDIAYPFSIKFESTKNRGQVQAEYFQAVKDGALPPVGDITYPPFQKVRIH